MFILCIGFQVPSQLRNHYEKILYPYDIFLSGLHGQEQVLSFEDLNVIALLWTSSLVLLKYDKCVSVDTLITSH